MKLDGAVFNTICTPRAWGRVSVNFIMSTDLLLHYFQYVTTYLTRPRLLTEIIDAFMKGACRHARTRKGIPRSSDDVIIMPTNQMLVHFHQSGKTTSSAKHM